jgi:hypothetical protein
MEIKSPLGRIRSRTADQPKVLSVPDESSKQFTSRSTNFNSEIDFDNLPEHMKGKIEDLPELNEIPDLIESEQNSYLNSKPKQNPFATKSALPEGAIEISPEQFNKFQREKEIIDKAWIKKDIIWKYVDWAKKNNVPLFAGEFGTDNFIKNEYRVAWANDLMDVLNELNIPWTYWEYKSIYGWGFSFSVINMETDNPQSGLFVNESLIKAVESKLKAIPKSKKK